MFDHARRFRVLAALGLVLVLAQGRAWGGETFWTKAAGLVRSIWEWPGALPPLPSHEERPECKSGLTSLGKARRQPSLSPAIFAWEKRDLADGDLAAASFLEAAGEYEWAYIRYKGLSRRFPGKPAFTTAAERVALKYWLRRTGGSLTGMWQHPHLEDVIPWWTKEEQQGPAVIDMNVLPPPSECSQVLIELGVITDWRDFPSAGRPATVDPWQGGIIF